jgi:hypothetical protein
MVMDKSVGVTSRTSQATGTTVGATTSSLYTYTFGPASASVFMSAVVTGYDSASRQTIGGKTEAIIRYTGSNASIIGTNYKFSNSDNAVVNFDITASGTTAVVRAFGTGSRTWVWGTTVTTQII